MKIRTICSKYGSRFLAVSGLSLLSTASFAALPPAIATAMTNLETDGLALFDLIWPVVIVLTGALVLMKLFKRGASKI